ncbi:MAG: hypothetical protein JNM31_05675 [Flavobacteriales bacterium]|nr:hypothetical protein [Flavobacteriales bacterium]
MVLRCAVLVGLAGTAWAAFAQDPLFRRFSTMEGMPSNTVYQAVQDKQGFIWFGTDAGAVRFDGTHLDRFDVAKGLSDEEVFGVKMDSKGRIWFLTGNGRPSFHDERGVHSPGNDSVLARVWSRTGIRSMYEDSAGALWFGGLKGEVVVLHPDGRVNDRVIDTLSDGMFAGHVTIAGRPDGSAVVFNNLTPLGRPVVPMADLSSTRGTTHMVQAHAGGRIFHTEPSAVREWNGNEWVVLLDTNMLPGQSGFHHAYPLGDDELWVTLWGGGVVWLVRKGAAWVPVRNAMFKEDLVNNVMRDREGNVWVCTDYGGVIMFTARAARTSFYKGGRGREEEFLRVHADPVLGVWCGTNQGDLYRLGRKLDLVDLPPEGPQFVRVSCIRSTDNALWTSTYGNVFRSTFTSAGIVHQDIPTEHAFKPGVRSGGGMKALATGRDGRVVATMYGVYSLNASSTAFRRAMDKDIPSVRIYAPHLDARGTLWFEDQHELYALGKQGLRRHPDLKVSPGLRIADITSWGDTLFLATNGEGVLVMHAGNVVTVLDERDGLSSGHVYHLFADGGELFVATERGADRVTGPWTAPRVHRYDAGLLGGLHDVRDVAADSTSAYVLVADGLCQLPRQQAAERPQIPLPYIRHVLRNDTLLRVHGTITMHRGRDQLQLELGAVHFDRPDEVRMEYRLDREASWQRLVGPWLDLAAVSAGDHLVQVRAALADGAWSTPVEIGLLVVPPVWERTWFIGLLALAGAIIVYTSVRAFLLRRYRLRMERIHQREHLVRERERIAMDLHDDLGAELSSLLLMTRMEREHPGPQSLQRVEQVVGQLTDKVKEVIWSTDPKLDTIEATLTFIQRHVLHICARHGLQVRTSLPPELPDLELSAGMRRELYLIAKEALNNVLKHGNASRFTMAAVLRDGALHLTFTDDGKGGTASLADGMGHGLRNMVARANALGGSLTLSEARPHGTRVHLQLPLEQARPNG